MMPLNLNVTGGSAVLNPALIPPVTTTVMVGGYVPPPPCVCRHTWNISGGVVMDAVRHPAPFCLQHGAHWKEEPC